MQNDDREQDIQMLVNWMCELEQQVGAHFSSASWKVGWFIVRALKGTMLRRHPPASTYRIHDIFRAFRQWKSRRQDIWADVRHVTPRSPVPLTILAGNLDEDSDGKAAQIGLWVKKVAATQVLGFSRREADKGFVLKTMDSVDMVSLPVCAFPEFHKVLASAVFRIAGRSLVTFSQDLLGLGLGLLCNFHTGKPLSVFTPSRQKAPPSGAEVNLDEPGLGDPTAGAWTRLLSDIAHQVPETSYMQWGPVAAVEVLPAAKRFAEIFAAYYENTRSRA